MDRNAADYQSMLDDTEEQAERAQTHWSYGSGSAGCLYDSGPSFAATLDDAIEAALCIFGDLPEVELEQAERALRSDGIHYFTGNLCAGADYVEVTEQAGPCPESDE